MDLVSFDPVWVAGTTNELSLHPDYTEFYELWGMDMSEWITVNQLFYLLSFGPQYIGADNLRTGPNRS